MSEPKRLNETIYGNSGEVMHPSDVDIARLRADIKYPVRLVRDEGSIEAHIRDASNRVIASKLIGRDAEEIVRVLNAAGKPELEHAVIEAAIEWHEGLDAQYDAVTPEEQFESDQRTLHEAVEDLLNARRSFARAYSPEIEQKIKEEISGTPV